MATFKVGDKVKAKDGRAFSPFGKEHCAVEGKVYEVANNDVTGLTLVDGPVQCIESRFELVEEASVSVKDTQVGGSHYHTLKIQPYEYVLANNLGPLELNIIKYVTRWKNKNGVEDLKKARHTLDYLIEYTETNNGS